MAAGGGEGFAVEPVPHPRLAESGSSSTSQPSLAAPEFLFCAALIGPARPAEAAQNMQFGARQRPG
jgi:hypothetical protein